MVLSLFSPQMNVQANTLVGGNVKSPPPRPIVLSGVNPALDLPPVVIAFAIVQLTSSTLICMPQHRNTANRIFGGFLMHRAYEVAFCAAFTFGGSRPRFSEIDEVFGRTKGPSSQPAFVFV